MAGQPPVPTAPTRSTRCHLVRTLWRFPVAAETLAATLLQSTRARRTELLAYSAPLIAGQTTAGINAAMQPGGTITGVVTDNIGHKLSNVCVRTGKPGAGTDGPVPSSAALSRSRRTGSSRPGTCSPACTPWASAAVSVPCQTRTAMVHVAARRRECQPRVGRPRRDHVPYQRDLAASRDHYRYRQRDHAGKPLSGICVCAGDPRWQSVPHARVLVLGLGVSATGGKGNYSVGGLAPGKVRPAVQ